MSSYIVQTNFKDNLGGDLGSILVTKDYFISVYPGLASDQLGIAPELWTWGYASRGQLGTNDTLNRSTPSTTFTGGTNWRQISSGYARTAAIKTDGTLWTWGYGRDGILGNGIITGSRLTPVTTFAGGTDWKQVSINRHACAAIKTDGTLWVWGNYFSSITGELLATGFIDNTSVNRSTPITTFAGGNNWRQVDVGVNHTVAIKTDGTLWTWGNSLFAGLAALGPKIKKYADTPVTTFAGGTNWANTATGLAEELYTASAGNSYATAIKTDGTLWVWGAASSGQLGTLSNPNYHITPVTTFTGGTNWKQVSAGSLHTTAIKTDGTLWATGVNSSGQLGFPTVFDRSTPVTTFAGGTNWADTATGVAEELYTISSGLTHTAAIKTDGTLWVWGNQVRCALGDFRITTTVPNTVAGSTPVTTFAGGTNWKQVSVSKNSSSFSQHTAAIKTDGTLWVWGLFTDGQLGGLQDITPGSPNRAVSTPVTTFSGGTNWKQVSAGNDHTAAIKTDGTLWTWGNNSSGQLGTPPVTINILTPVTTFAGGTNWADTATGVAEELYTLSSGRKNTLAIKTDGTLWTWGVNSSSQLGINAGNPSLTPVTTFAGGTNWRQVTSSTLTSIDFGCSSMAIKTDGTLWVWGNNVGSGNPVSPTIPFSRLGIGNNNILVPTPVTTFAGGTNWKQVQTKYNHCVAIKTDGTLWTWGYGNFGRLGNATASTFLVSNTPITTFAGGTTWKHASAGAFHSAAIKTDGTLWLWGRGQSGQLGTNDSVNRSTPVTTFAGGTNWKQVDCSYEHTIAVKTDGTLWVWGYDFVGTLGLNVTAFNNIFTPVTTFAGGTTWKQASAGKRYNTAVKTDGTLWVWGYVTDNNMYILGTGNLITANTPITTFAGGTSWKQVSSGYDSVSALKDDGVNKELYLWGHIDALGINSQQNNAPNTTFAGGTNWSSVNAGYTRTAAIKTDGTLWTWGSNNNGQLGNASIVTTTSTPVTTFAGGTNWRQVSIGSIHTSAVKTDGTLWVWGNTNSGRLGNTVITSSNISTPVTTFAGGTNWKQVSAASHTAAIKTDGTLWTWGSGNSGRLGNADITDRSTPVTTFVGGTSWKQVSASARHTIALRDDGINKQIYLWGSNTDNFYGSNQFNGLLGFLSTNTLTVFERVDGNVNWKQVSTGNNHTAAVKTDGTLWTWGGASQGQLGVAFDVSTRFTPVTTFAGGTDWKQVSAGDQCTAAVKTDGTLWTWGTNSSGQLANTLTSISVTPGTTFAGGTNWNQVNIGSRSQHMAAIKTDGTLWVWGNNQSGQLGNAAITGFSVAVSTPITTFAGGTNWKQVHTANYSTYAVKTNGTLWSWGFADSNGVLGNFQSGGNSTVSTPVTTFAGGTNWTQVSSSNLSVIAVKSDSTVWTWGNNTNCELGLFNYLRVPVEVIDNSTNWKTASAGYRYTTAIKTDGTLWTWGSNYNGTLGINDDINRTTPVTTFAGGTNWKQVSSKYNYTGAIKTDGTLWTWGYSSNGGLGQLFAGASTLAQPQEVYPKTTDWKDTATTNPEDLYTISAGYTNAAIKTNGTLWTWGNGYYGELGINLNEFRTTPVTTFAGGTNWRQISTGYGVSAGIKTDGTLWTWGYNYYGALGNGYFASRIGFGYFSTPVTTSAGGTNWKHVSVSHGYYVGKTCVGATKTDGTLWTWGYNYYYQLGQFPIYERYTPVTTVLGGTNWADTATGAAEELYTISAGKGVAFGDARWASGAIKTDGTLWMWGLRDLGQLGNAFGTGFGKVTPITTFAGGTNWRQLETSINVSAAIKTDGTLWMWGNGSYGRLGNASAAIGGISTPITTFTGGTNWRQVNISTLGRVTAAVKTDGTLWTWGSSSPQLGILNPGTTNRSTPITTSAGGTDWKQVSLGFCHAAAIKTDGTLWTWGVNSSGELGALNIPVGGTTPSGGSVDNPATTFSGGTNWADTATGLPEELYTLSAGVNHTAAIKTDGTLWVWGNSIRGQLGNTDLFSDKSTAVTTFAGGTNWKQVSNGSEHTAAVKTDGTLWVWGTASLGRLGDSSTATSFWISTPLTTFAGGTNWKQVTAGGFHTAAIKTDGTLWTWGYGNQGQLGNGGINITRSTPITTFAGGTDWKQVSVGTIYTTAIKTDGTLWVWGNTPAIQPYLTLTYNAVAGTVNGICNTTTQLSGTTTFAPVPNSGTRITTSAGDTGTVTTIANSLQGIGSLTEYFIPTVGGNDDGYWPVTLPFSISYNGTSYSTIYVGTNSYVTFGDGSSVYSSLSFSNPLLQKIMISAKDNSCQRFCYGSADGTAPNRTYRIRWEGTNATGGTVNFPNIVWEMIFYENTPNQIDLHVGVNVNFTLTGPSNISTPITVYGGGTNWKQVSAGKQCTAAIKTDGTLWTWGFNVSGQLGNASTGTVSTPITTFAGGTNWKQVSAGDSHTAAIKTDGTLWTWGNNSNGQLGNDTTSSIAVSTPITTLIGGTDWKQVELGDDYTVAIKGSVGNMLLYAWGNNFYSQLGFLTTNASFNPITTFAGGTNWKQVTAGDKITLAVKTDGTLWTWGNGTRGQLGNARASNVLTPITTFLGGTNWKQVDGHLYTSAAVKTDGTLWTWGYGIYGQLGINSTTPDRSTPVTTFAGGTNWKQVNVSSATVLALKDTAGSKEIWSWGSNDVGGNLGLTRYIHRYEPVRVEGSDWNYVDMGYTHTAAIKTDGTLWLWGDNEGYALSIPNQGDERFTPITVSGGGTNWKQISAGGYFNAAVKTDGTLWTWGECFSDGRLGNNTVIPQILPSTTFAGGTNWKHATCGYETGSAVKTDGTLWTWGSGFSGKLGNGTVLGSITPVTTFVGGTNWTQVSVRTGPANLALKSNGTLWSWGETIYTGTNIPIKIITPATTFAGGTNWKQISCGESAGAIKTDGTLWTWGRRSAVGNSGNSDINTPVTTFLGGTNWKQVSSSQVHMSVIKSIDY
jgi:alpha-tubulin suppressor-like RCC1 family protein